METVDLSTLEQGDSPSTDEALSLLDVRPPRKEMKTGRSPVAGARAHNVLVVVPSGPARRWQMWLADRLRSVAGVEVRVISSPARPARSPGLELLLRVEQSIFGLAGERAFDRVDMRPESPEGGRSPRRCDLVLDLTETGYSTIRSARRLRPLFDGEPTSMGLVQALLDRRLPFLEVADDARAAPVVLGQVAVENPEVLTLGLDNVLSRLAAALVSYIEAICRGDAADRYSDRSDSYRAPVSASRNISGLVARAGGRTLHKLTSAVAKRLDFLASGGHSWSIAYCREPSRGFCAQAGVLDPAAFTILPDDGARYFADPFAIVRQGCTWVFCEEFVYATGKGHISAFSLDAHGRRSDVRPVLETDHHLSYPQVFAADGAIWMIPESAACQHVPLYRCIRFPDRWEQVAVLVEGDLHDATVFRHDGRWWMTAASRDWRASSWDTLALFHADRLLGPWVASPTNPVLIDVKSARPAGAPFMFRERLVRPAQDCSGGYGSRLTLAEITHLSPDKFEQQVLGSMAFESGSGLLGPHTLNRAGGWMLLDVYGSSSRKRI